MNGTFSTSTLPSGRCVEIPNLRFFVGFAPDFYTQKIKNAPQAELRQKKETWAAREH